MTPQEFRLCTITVYIKPPNSDQIMAHTDTIDPRLWYESFAPLPKERELPWEFKQREQAKRMIQNRKALSADVASHIAASLIKYAEDHDTINGYTKEEYHR